VNRTTNKTSRSGSSQRPDSRPILRGGQIRAAHKCHYDWQRYKSSEYMFHRFSFRYYLTLDTPNLHAS
jgi:hypothetical protein